MLGRGGQRADRRLVVEAGKRGGPNGPGEQLTRRPVAELRGRLARPGQLGRMQHARVGQRRGVPGQPGLAGQPVVRPGNHADAPVAERDQVRGHAPRPGEVRGRDGGDVARDRSARIDHDQREPPGAQRGQLLAGFRRQDHDCARHPRP